MNRSLTLLTGFALVGFVGCQPVEKQVVGTWVSSDWRVEFRADGTFAMKRGLIETSGKYIRVDKEHIRLEYEGAMATLLKLKETLLGPKPEVLKVSFEKGNLILQWPEEGPKVFVQQ